MALWPWFVWPIAFVPVTILLHEMGHLIVARSLGFRDATLHFSAVNPGPSYGAGSAGEGLVGLAGPLVTVVLTAVGIFWAYRDRAAVWPYCLAVAAASRFAVSVPYSVAAILVRMSGRRLADPAFDEHKAATALGWSGDLLLGATSTLPVLVLIWLSLRLPRGSKLKRSFALLVGTGFGWFLWMGLLGPRLLP